MPQLMPLYWIYSAFMCIFFLILMIKINGNYINMKNNINLVKISNNSNSWYW